MVAKVYKYTKVHEDPNGLVGVDYYCERKLTRAEQNAMVTEEGLVGILHKGRVMVTFTLPNDVLEFVPES